MGSALQAPVTSVVVERSSSDVFRVGLAEMNGWRNSMEDSHVIHTTPAWGFFSVLDGHGGDACSIYVAKRLHEELAAMREPPDNAELTRLIFELDREFLGTQQSSGSTCTFCIASPPTAAGGRWRLRVGNIGDSRVLLGRADGTMVEGEGTDGCITVDHKPDDASEHARIVRCGGHVETAAGGVARVNGDLAVSRAFGDAAFKRTGGPSQEDHPVTAEPEYFELEADETDFLMLVCDGISEGQFPNREVIKLAAERLAENPNDPTDACTHVCHEAIRCNSKDNLSCMIVQLGARGALPGAPLELLPGPFASSPCDSGFKKAYGAMCEHAHVSIAESMEKRYSLVQERVRALRAEPGAEAPGWLREPVEELEEELFKFGEGPPEGAAKEERVGFFEQWLEAGEQSDEPDIPGLPPNMMQLLRSRPQLLQQLQAAGGPAAVMPELARQEERLATVCDKDTLRGLIDKSPSLKWDERLGDLANTTVNVQQDDDSDGTSMIHSQTLGIRGWIPRAALQDCSETGAPLKDERMATVCAPDKLRMLVEESRSLMWDDSLAELANTKVTVLQDDDSDGTSRVRVASGRIEDPPRIVSIPQAALQAYMVRVASLEVLKPALEAHPGLKWDDRRADMACQEGRVTQVDYSDDTAKVTFPQPISLSAWFPMDTLEEVVPSPEPPRCEEVFDS